MDAKYQNIRSELNYIKDKLESVLAAEQELKKDMRMIFADITHFENLVLKILDKENNKNPSEDFHH